MTKEITKAYILQQLQDKFGLREFEAAKFLFGETVQPVYEIERSVEEAVARWIGISITSATGFLFYTVPQGDRWWLQRYTVVFMGAGAHKITGVFIRRKNELVGASSIYLDMTLGQTVSYMNDLPKAVRLDSGDGIWILVDDYTSTQNLRLYIDYIREVLR